MLTPTKSDTVAHTATIPPPNSKENFFITSGREGGREGGKGGKDEGGK
jgi:hypothetical protein